MIEILELSDVFNAHIFAWFNCFVRFFFNIWLSYILSIISAVLHISTDYVCLTKASYGKYLLWEW